MKQITVNAPDGTEFTVIKPNNALNLPKPPQRPVLSSLVFRQARSEENKRDLAAAPVDPLTIPEFKVDIEVTNSRQTPPLKTCGGGNNNFNSWQEIHDFTISFSKVNDAPILGDVRLKISHGVLNCNHCFSRVNYRLRNRVPSLPEYITHEIVLGSEIENTIIIHCSERLNDQCECVPCNETERNRCTVFIRCDLYYNGKKIENISVEHRFTPTASPASICF